MEGQAPCECAFGMPSRGVVRFGEAVFFLPTLRPPGGAEPSVLASLRKSNETLAPHGNLLGSCSLCQAAGGKKACVIARVPWGTTRAGGAWDGRRE